MRVAVVGAGIVGVTTAYELAADGHRVTVFERRGSVAAEASFANAGVVAPGDVAPWSAPGMPSRWLRSLASRHAAMRLGSRLNLETLHWLANWRRACKLPTSQVNRLRMQRLASYSLGRLQELTARLGLAYERSDGCLVLLRGAREAAAIQPGLESLAALGMRFEMLDSQQCRLVEPGIDAETPLHGGLHLPNDEVGNCRQFAGLLRLEAERLGVRFRFHTTVQQLLPGRDPELTFLHEPPGEAQQQGTVDAGPKGAGFRSAGPRDAADTVPMREGPLTRPFDRIIVCAALGATALLRPHGLKLPLLAVHGYSVTAPLRHHELHPDQGPRSALMDERYKVAITRLGGRIRVAGGAELGGNLQTHHSPAIATLYKVLHDWFPGVAQLAQAQHWKGARPMLPDGPPVIGPSGIEGVLLNLGHGSCGWALACGSARLLADSVAGKRPAIDSEGLGIERLREMI